MFYVVIITSENEARRSCSIRPGIHGTYDSALPLIRAIFSRLLKDVEYKHLIINIKINSHSTALKFHICGVIIIIRDIPAFQSTTIL